MKIIMAGASGFIGRALLSEFAGSELVALSRSDKPLPGARMVTWDGRSSGPWEAELDGAEAIVNLIGAPVTLKWTAKNRCEILESRVASTHAIGRALQTAKNPPLIWINSSAVGFYGDAKDAILTEGSPGGLGFLAGVCKSWEAAAMEPELPAVRRVLLRTGLPLGRGGGAMEPFLKMARYGLGGSVGDGSQWWPWIHIEDLTAMVRWIVENQSVAGPVNGSGPEPVRNRDLMKAIRHALHRPWAPPAPRFALGIVGKLIGPDSEVLLASQRAVPKVALDRGFQWRYRSLDAALRQLID